MCACVCVFVCVHLDRSILNIFNRIQSFHCLHTYKLSFIVNRRWRQSDQQGKPPIFLLILCDSIVWGLSQIKGKFLWVNDFRAKQSDRVPITLRQGLPPFKRTNWLNVHHTVIIGLPLFSQSDFDLPVFSCLPFIENERSSIIIIVAGPHWVTNFPIVPNTYFFFLVYECLKLNDVSRYHKVNSGTFPEQI